MSLLAPPPVEIEPDIGDWCRSAQGLHEVRVSPGDIYNTVDGEIKFETFDFSDDVASVAISPLPVKTLIAAVDGHRINCQLTTVEGNIVTFRTDDIPSAMFEGTVRVLLIASDSVPTKGVGGYDLGGWRENACYTPNTIMGGGCNTLLIFGLPLAIIAFSFSFRKRAPILTAIMIAFAILVSVIMTIVLQMLAALGVLLAIILIAGISLLRRG